MIHVLKKKIVKQKKSCLYLKSDQNGWFHFYSECKNKTHTHGKITITRQWKNIKNSFDITRQLKNNKNSFEITKHWNNNKNIIPLKLKGMIK